VKIKAYQYVDNSLPFLNSDPPEDLTLKRRAKDAIDKMKAAGFPIPQNGFLVEERARFVEFMEGMVDIATQLAAKTNPSIAVRAQEIEGDTSKKDKGS
jgi:hypothetical protein